MKKGKLIVIDGTDGSGKATQTTLLVKALKKHKIPAQGLDFPQYQSHFGKLVARYLKNEFGRLDPHIASVLYAVNRLEYRDKLRQWLKEGKTVVLNRYVSSNQIHQAANIDNKTKRREFVSWIGKMEYETLGLPRPDLVLYLSVDPVVAYELVVKKDAKSRRYVGGSKRDMLEADLEHQRRAIKQSLDMLKSKNYKWKKIECMEKGKLLSKQEIASKIWAAINQH